MLAVVQKRVYGIVPWAGARGILETASSLKTGEISILSAGKALRGVGGFGGDGRGITGRGDLCNGEPSRGKMFQ